MEGTLERGGDLFPLLSRQEQQEEQQVEGRGWEEGKLGGLQSSYLLL